MTLPTDVPASIGFDTETNVTSDQTQRILHVIIISSRDWVVVLDVHRCSTEADVWVVDLLENPNIVKIAHNGSFDWMMMKLNDVIVQNIHDTMNTEIVLRNGLLSKVPSLAELLQDMGIYISKTLQTSFTGEPLSDEQIWYAASDAMHLHALRDRQMNEANEKELLTVVILENAIVPAMAKMELDGIRISPDRWTEARTWAEEEFYKVRDELLAALENDPVLLTHAIQSGDIVTEDTLTINWNSPQQVKEVVMHCMPPMTGLSKPVLERSYKLALQEGEDEWAALFMECLNKNWKPLEAYLMSLDEHHQWLVDHGYLRLAGTHSINWNSPVQMLKYAKLINPRLDSVGEDALKRQDHPFLKKLVKYAEWNKKVSTYGDSFLQNIAADGRIHSNWQQVWPETGRTSSRNPNMQNIPKLAVYRRCFIPEKGNVFCGSDFAGQEAVLAAYAFREPSWIDAIKRGEDMHSAVAVMVYPKEWKDVQEEDCEFAKTKRKCKCVGHMVIRDKVKSVNFGIIYQQTEFGLSEALSISRNEALSLINFYYAKLPILARNMQAFKNFGLRNGYTMSLAPFKRKRWFRYWEENRRHVDNFLNGVDNNSTLAEIGRQGVNTPIQGAGADMIKYALFLMYRELLTQGRLDRVKFCLLVHDELVTETSVEEAEEQKERLHRCMIAAGSVIVKGNLITADTKIKTEWTK